MPTPSAGPAPDEVSGRSWALLGFLTLLNVLNFVDRHLIAALAPLLIEDLGLSRTEIGLLAGFGFVLLYTFVGLFLGLAADRWRRLPLIAAGLALWSAMTALSGWARSFVQLAIPRIFVGVGESTLTPAALSMLGDSFPARRLALATGVYYAGIPLGGGVSMIAASWIAPRYGWRACFFVLGGIGLVAVAALALFREPARRTRAAAAEPPSLGRLAREVFGALARRRDLALTLAGGALLTYGAASTNHLVTWLVEERNLPYARAAFSAGAIGVVAGFAGNLAAGAFGDLFARRFRNGHLWSLVPLAALFALSGLGFYLLPAGTTGFHVAWFLAAACTTGWFGPLFAAIQELAPPHTRASTVAFAILVLNLLGVGSGPLITGLIGDARSLTAGLAVTAGVVALAVVPFALAASRRHHPEVGP